MSVRELDRSAKAAGFKIMKQDDPIYSEGPTITFVNHRPQESRKKKTYSTPVNFFISSSEPVKGKIGAKLRRMISKIDPGMFSYDWGTEFKDGLAEVKRNGKSGFVDKTGREVVPLIYDWASAFSEGLAKIKRNGQYGFVDSSGREAVPPRYDNVYDFKEGLGQVMRNKK